MNNKLSLLIFKILTVMFVLGAAASTIVNLAVSGEITWAAYPLASTAFAWIICIPVFFGGKHRGLLTLLTLTVATLPFLYVLGSLWPYGNWFFELGMPQAVISLICLWVCYVVFKYTKLNIWHKFAIVVFIIGVVCATAVRFYLAGFTGDLMATFLDFDSVVNVISSIAVTILLIIVGMGKRPAVKGDERERQ